MKHLRAIILAAFVATTPASADDDFAGLAAVSDGVLDETYGGYVDNSGIEITFGIETAVSITSATQTQVTQYIQNMSDTNMTAVINSGGSLAVVDTSSLRNIIQNNVDNQNISIITQLNVTVTNMSFYRNLNLADIITSQTLIK